MANTTPSVGITGLPEFNPAVLQTLVDQTLLNTIPSFADTYLPDENIFSPNFTYEILKSNPSIAGFVGYGSEPPKMDVDSIAKGMGEVAKMGHSYILTYEELMALNQARTTEEQRAQIDALTFKNIRLVENIRKLASASKMQAIATGKFKYDRNDVKIDVDYKIPAEHKIVLSVSTWADPAHDVIGDLLNWNDLYVKNNMKSPDVILMTRETQALLLKNTIIVTESGRPPGSTRVNVEELTSILGGYGLPPVQIVTETVNRYVDDYTGELIEEELFPKNRVIFVSQDVGKFYYGPTLENNMQPGIKLLAEDLRQPIRSIVEVHAAGFPVIQKPSLILHADVYTL